MDSKDPASTSDSRLHRANRLPREPIDRLTKPFVRFLHVQSASGIILLACTFAALVLANSPLADAFADFWQTPLGIAFGGFELKKPLLLWINDGLMTIFFFVVGLEIKRELVTGELRDPKKAMLPVMAALGGMLVPAAIYWSLRRGQPGHEGWGIPMATDIAFVVGFLAILPRTPLGLKILLLTLAIADDIGAILVIAIFYSTDISLFALALAGGGLALVVLLRGLGVRSIAVYLAVGVAIWLAVLKSGIHPTVAGVLLGLMTPARAWVDSGPLQDIMTDVLDWLRGSHDGLHQDRHAMLEQLQKASLESISPLERLETSLHPWVAFVIMPVFALANAGVAIEPRTMSHPVAWAVAAGLVVGKPLGIVAFSWLAVRLGLARLPTSVNWKLMIGAGALAGIGFTMSLFIAGLGLTGELLDAGKFGTLIGSAVSAVLGSLLLLIFLRGQADR